MAEMEAAERYDPAGVERIELAVAALTSTVQGVLSAFGGGKPMSPDEIAPDWGGLRRKARRKARREAAAGADLLAAARARAEGG